MGNLKQIIKSFILLLVFIAGAGSNVLFAASSDSNNKTSCFSQSENHSETIPFLFQPLEDKDSENEEDESEYFSPEIISLTFGQLSAILESRHFAYPDKPSLSHCAIWQLNCNFRL